MKQSKNKVLAPLFLAAAFTLAGCSNSTVVARPGWIDESIIENITSKNNTLKEIFDAIKNLGTTNAAVLNKVLFDIAQKQIGKYEDLAKFTYGDDTEYTDDDLIKFINEHPIYKTTDTVGYVRNGDTVSKETLEDSDRLKISKSKIQSTWKNIENLIYEALYNEVKGGTYSIGDVKNFSEESYIFNLYKNMQCDNTPDYYEGTEEGGLNIDLTDGLETDGVQFNYRKNNCDWEQFVECKYHSKTEKGIRDITAENPGFLTVKCYKKDGNEYKPTEKYIYKSSIYGKHIINKILPSVYQDLLVQNYVKTQRYNTLGRSYARKVNMISYTSDEQNLLKITSLFNDFAKKYICGDGGSILPQENYNIEILSNCLKGFYDTTKPEQLTLLNDNLEKYTVSKDNPSVKEKDKEVRFYLNGDTESEKYYTVFKGTKLASLVEKINKVINPTPHIVDQETGEMDYYYYDLNGAQEQYIYRQKIDTTALDDLTNKNAYSIKDGIIIKQNEIIATNFTKDGWQTKSSLSDLPDSSKNKLFNITTSNIVDDYNRKKDGKFDINYDYARYFPIASDPTKSKCFLVNENIEPTSTYAQSMVLSDKSSKKVSIVEIEDAVSISKLTLQGSSNYAYLKASVEKTKSIIEMNELTNGILKQVASGDTYKKSANQYYLMISNIVFHDQAIYDYFKSQFPDLFK